MDQGKLKLVLKTEAVRLGFSLFGVTTPKPPEHFSVFQSWLQNGYQAEMDYLNRQDTLRKRSDPQLLLPSCRSIICLGYPYKLRPPGDGFEVASYAKLEDYHLVFPRLLSGLLTILADHSAGSDQSSVFTDSAPVLERELASRAGLGWIGRNSCLLSPSAGSAFLLAEIFTTLALEPDASFSSDRCGTCTRCVEACPTGCILANRTINAGRCISYLTIENGSDIPLEFRNLVGNHIFGCDICQQVCPWNVKNHISSQPEESIFFREFIPKLARMTEIEFKTCFSKSPFLRTGRLGLLRNGVIVLGNSLNPDYLSIFEDIASAEPDPVIQELTRWAIRSILRK